MRKTLTIIILTIIGVLSLQAYDRAAVAKHKGSDYILVESSSIYNREQSIMIIGHPLPEFTTFAPQDVSIKICSGANSVKVSVNNSGGLLREEDCEVIWDENSATIIFYSMSHHKRIKCVKIVFVDSKTYEIYISK